MDLAEELVETLLITGAAGRVGTALRPWLRREFRLRLFDLSPVDDLTDDEASVVGDLTRDDDVRAAVDGVSVVLHLACVHGPDLGFEASLDANYRAQIALLDAVRNAGVRRFVYASSHHVLGMHRRAEFPGEMAEFAPDAFYGLGKAFGELACALYARKFGLETFVIRIGNADPTVRDDRALRMWVSARDLARLITIGSKDPRIVYDVVYGVSECPEPLFTNARAAELGYRPIDRAIDYLDPAFVSYEAMPDALGREWVGGAYAVASLPARGEST